MKLRITKQDRDKAIEATNQPDYSCNCDCVVAQAIKRVLKTDNVMLGTKEFRIDDKRYLAAPKLHKAMKEFGWRDTMHNFPLGEYYFHETRTKK
jgi:hypothetical protein